MTQLPYLSFILFVVDIIFLFRILFFLIFRVLSSAAPYFSFFANLRTLVEDMKANKLVILTETHMGLMVTREKLMSRLLHLHA
jgi:hypothetical protein